MATTGTELGGFTRRPPRHRRLDNVDEQRQRSIVYERSKHVNITLKNKNMFAVKDEDLEIIVRKAVNSSDKVKIISHSVESFSKNRHGIMGNHYILSVKVEIGSSIDHLQFFVKTPSESTTLRDSIVDEWVIHEEVHFFAQVYPKLMANYKAARWCPKCYLSKTELLVFEDLRSQGFSIRPDGIFDEQSLKSALSTLARFHASSIIAEVVLAKPLDRVYPKAFREKIFTDVGKGGRSNQLGFHTMQLLAANKFKLEGATLLPNILTRLCQLVKPVPGGCNVICHGDLWRSNIMFEAKMQEPECIIVDYQMLRYASPNCDLAVLLYVHASPEFRASSELQMLTHYYSIFQRTILDSDLQAAPRIPSFHDFLHDYQQRKLIGLACAAMRWPKIVFQQIMNDPEALKHWYFENRIDIYEKVIEQDSKYAEMMRDCLVELIEEGKRHLHL